MTVRTRAWPEGYDAPVDFAKLGRLFRQAREARGWSRADMTAASGVPASTVQQVEGGGNSELRTLVRLAQALDLPLASLIAEATVTPAVTEPVHNAASSLGGVDAPRRADSSDRQLLQRIAIAILHLVGAPELPPEDRTADPDKPAQG